VIVIEHNLDVIKTADWIVDLGPEGGERGGRVVGEGTPERIAKTTGSATGEYLARVLRGEPLVPLTHVSFAEDAGRAPRAGRRNGKGAGGSNALKTAAKRAAAVVSVAERANSDEPAQRPREAVAAGRERR
jgi:excinuclease ABC subunit A